MKVTNRENNPILAKKNFFRDVLSKLKNKCINKPIIITAIYKHKDNDIWATFVHVKPYINNKFQNKNTKIKYNQKLCGHINISRNDIEKYFKLSEEYDNENFIIIANLIEYTYYGMKRIGLKLYEENYFMPFRLKTINTYIDKSVFSKCYEYSKDDLLSI